jgi:hypothetical protein
VALAAPTIVAGEPVNGSPASYDDVVWPVALPLNLTLYNQRSANVQVSSNGVISLETLDYEFTNYALPYFNSEQFLDTGALPVWDDLYIYQGTQQGIFYEVDGTAPDRNVTFEWYCSHYMDSTQYYHFLAKFYEARPNVVTFTYLNMSDLGTSATVGVESYSGIVFSAHVYRR